MGIYLNPDNANFLEVVRSGKYVDKSMLIEILNGKIGIADEKFVCVSRPRRFGKSMAEDMISAYYSKGADSRELFSNLKISKAEDFERNLNKFNVIKIDLNALNAEWKITGEAVVRPSVISYLTKILCDEFRKEFSDLNFPKEESVSAFIKTVYSETRQTFIIIIDEYDCLVRDEVPQEEFQQYLLFLMSLFKNSELRSAISLAYITGILPIIRDKIQSKLNTFEEFSMVNPSVFAEFIGFTSEEVQEICEKKEINFEECKSWYDGYKLKGYEIYNPQAIMRVATRKEFASYWSETSTYAVVMDKINMNLDGTRDDVVRMIGGEKVSVNVTRYRNTMTDFDTKDDVFTFLIHLGYLAYDDEEKKCYIPNKEIHREWQNAIENNSDYAQTNKIIKASEELLNETLKGNEAAVAKALDLAHIHATTNRSYNNEDGLQSAVYLAYIYALNKYIVVREMSSGKGIADIVYIPIAKNIPALIIELKHNKSTESAINQIKEKKYFESLNNYFGDVLFVGINYDEKDKSHECKIEKLVKE